MTGSYYVVQHEKDLYNEFKERMADIGGMDVKDGNTIIWTNSDTLIEELRTRNEDGGDQKATERAIRRGVLNQLKKRSWEEDDCSWIAYLDWNGTCKDEVSGCKDEVSGEVLPNDGVKQARQEEIKELKKHDVYKKVPIEECWACTGQDPIKVKWVDVNKGDKVHPEYRSRLVAKEIKTDKRIDLFAATPPLEGKKLLIALAVTRGVGYEEGDKEGGMKLDFIDIRRAFFQALAKRNVYVELPEEDSQPGMCGKLNKAMYGTRDAAQNWEYAYAEFMESIGFIRGLASSCMLAPR